MNTTFSSIQVQLPFSRGGHFTREANAAYWVQVNPTRREELERTKQHFVPSAKRFPEHSGTWRNTQMSPTQMKISLALLHAFLFVSTGNIQGAPVTRMVGCGQGKALPWETKKFCCERFNLDCTRATPKPVRAKDVEERIKENDLAHERRKEEHRRMVVSIRMLGESCSQENDKCAVGLHCLKGFCTRTRGAAHLKDLIERGKVVEEVEKEDSTVGSRLREDQGASQEVIVKGQAVKIDDTDPSDDADDTLAEGMTSLSGPANVNEKPPLQEEDELAANIADLLSSRLGVSLDNVEMHSIRQLIAGTLDERAQREDQVEENEVSRQGQGQPETSKHKAKARQVSPAKSGVNKGAFEGSLYEPLVQCSSDLGSSRVRKEAADASKIGRTAGRYIHADI